MMIDPDLGHFGIRAISVRELSRQAAYTKSMLFGAAAASLAIVGAGAFFVSLWM